MTKVFYFIPCWFEAYCPANEISMAVAFVCLVVGLAVSDGLSRGSESASDDQA